MKNRTLLTSALLAALIVPTAAFAGDRLDHDEVKKLRDTRKILSMEEVIARSRTVQPGQVVDVELENKDGNYVYEMKILGDDGRVHKLYLDAADGSVIKRKDDKSR